MINELTWKKPNEDEMGGNEERVKLHRLMSSLLTLIDNSDERLPSGWLTPSEKIRLGAELETFKRIKKLIQEELVEFPLQQIKIQLSE